MFFDSGKDEIRAEASRILDVIASQMTRDTPDTSLVILGYTDGQGLDEYNYSLSVRRATSVMTELAKR